MATSISAQVVFQGKLRFTGKIDGLPQELSIDYHPPLGERAGFTGLETLLLALAGCSGQTVVYVLGKMKQPVDRMEVRVSGKRRDEHPTILTAIDLAFVVSGPALQADKVAQAIRAAEEQYCPVWAMLKGGTAIHSSFQIV